LFKEVATIELEERKKEKKKGKRKWTWALLECFFVLRKNPIEKVGPCSNVGKRVNHVGFSTREKKRGKGGKKKRAKLVLNVPGGHQTTCLNDQKI